VAGIVALVLEANPNLTYRDVQAILINSTTVNDHADGDWTSNGAGFMVNHKYGFGLINANQAVTQAQSYALLPQEKNITVPKTSVGLAIPDFSRVSTAIEVSQSLTMEHVEITVWIQHASRGDLDIRVTSPTGTVSVLAEPHSDTAANFDGWTFTTIRSWGESSEGRWTLTVEDKKQGKTGIINFWQVIIYGH